MTICATSCNSCRNKSSSHDYNVSFKGRVRNSCNIPGHYCAYGVDNNSDGWCDNCWENGYKCHIVNHQGL